MLPLYAQNTIRWNELFRDANTAHAGLLFDKFPDGWNPDEHYQPKHRDRNGKVIDDKKTFFDLICNKYRQTAETHLNNNLDSALNRQRDLVNHLQGVSLTVTTNWRFISGLGTAHPYEAGFIWHRTLSVPYLSGSSVKGLMRAWAEQWGGLPEQQEITRLFGAEKEEACCGALIIFDALPTKPPKLEVDILNPHYSEYYKDGKPPADYLSPKPVFFLTVAAGHEFEFFLAPRKDFYLNQPKTTKHTAEEDLKTAKTLLSNALVCLGAGGKTAVGYGQMTSLEYKAKQWLDETIEALKIDINLRGQPEETLWKKSLSEKWLRASEELKQPILELIQSKWADLKISWEQPKGPSAEAAKRNFMNR